MTSAGFEQDAATSRKELRETLDRARQLADVRPRHWLRPVRHRRGRERAEPGQHDGERDEPAATPHARDIGVTRAMLDGVLVVGAMTTPRRPRKRPKPHENGVLAFTDEWEFWEPSFTRERASDRYAALLLEYKQAPQPSRVTVRLIVEGLVADETDISPA